MPRKDLKLRQEYLHDWYLRNRDRWKKHVNDRYHRLKAEILPKRREFRQKNKVRIAAWLRAYYHSNPARRESVRRSSLRQRENYPDRWALYQRRWRVRTRYGLSEQEFNKMTAVQQNRCAICRHEETRRSSLSVDHDHRTGAIRELLCHRCNTTLGLVKEDRRILKAMVSYLEKHREENDIVSFAA